MNKFYWSFIISFFIVFISMAHAQTGSLNVEISNINDPKGLMSIGLFLNEEGFPDNGKEYKGINVKVAEQTIVYTFKDIPYGSYAIAVFHDINSNYRLDKNFLGIPKEGYAFSNNVFGAFGLPPGFKDASFQVAGDKTIKIKMKY